MSIPVKTKLNYPVSLSEAKRHLRLEDDFHEDDDYVQNLIYAATQKAEQYIGKDISTTNNVQTLNDFLGCTLYIDEGNFISFTEAITDASALVNIDVCNIFYNSAVVDFVSPVDSDPLVIKYVTGFNEGECPAIIKQAIMIKIADLYDVDRQSYLMGSMRENKAFEALLDSFRYISF
jgi:hypothetical protein